MTPGLQAVHQQRPKARIGIAALTRHAFEGADLSALWNKLLEDVSSEPGNSAAIMDLSVIAQLLHDPRAGARLQYRALKIERIYRSPCRVTAPRLRLLAIAGVTDIGGNIPLEFLLSDSDVELATIYVAPDLSMPNSIPEHDLAIVAIGNSDRMASTIEGIAPLLETWPRPVLNRPSHIGRLERDRLCRLVQPLQNLVCPQTARVERATLASLGLGGLRLDGLLSDGVFPIIARPIDSHAGKGLEKLDQPSDIGGYLAERPESDFFVSRYVDYRSADGLFRKYRVVFIDGLPFPSHMAIADQWKVWYLNANMEQSSGKRSEEEHFMTRFDAEFAHRHRDTFEDLVGRVGLEYFGIDCAETRDGKLVLFEGETALIVHDMDPPEVYPYKGPQMRKLFAGFVDMLYRRAGIVRAQAAQQRLQSLASGDRSGPRANASS